MVPYHSQQGEASLGWPAERLHWRKGRVRTSVTAGNTTSYLSTTVLVWEILDRGTYVHTVRRLHRYMYVHALR